MKNIAILGIVAMVLLVVGVSGCTSSGTDSGQPAINVTNLKVASTGYGFYSVSGKIVPNKDIDYLEAHAIWYDSSGAVIETSPLLWNINNAKKGQVYKFKGEDSLYQKGTPAKVDVLIFDSPFSGGDTSSAIYKKTITL